jgi:hypothetical protein
LVSEKSFSFTIIFLKMFDDYELAVLQDYSEKKAKGELWSNMMHPTPGKLKKESLAVFDRRYHRKDEVTLRSFFDITGDTDTFRPAIKRWETDKFRPPNLVLNKGTQRTDEKNIELLAWLIDFQPRPYAVWLKDRKEKKDLLLEQQEGKTEEPQPNEQENNDGIAIPVGQPPKRPDNPDKRFPYRQVFTYAAIIIVIVLTGYFFLLHRPSSGGNCMYWTGDHYERIACNVRPDDTTVSVIALDSNKWVHFKRITRADTLTAASVGKVWYININGAIEYYTAPGEHPVYPDRRLLPLTVYILNKYPRKAG